MFTYKETVDLLNGADDVWLYQTANQKKEEAYGKEVYLRAIIEPWNLCKNSCLYCGLRRENTSLTRFALDFDDIYQAGLGIVEHGITSLVLQAGEIIDNDKVKLVTRLIKELKKATHADITLSFGEHPDYVYEEWKDAGADRYLLKIETLNETVFKNARPGSSMPRRIDRIKKLIELGYQAGSGFIAGMPGYTNEMLAQDILKLKDMGIHMFSLSPFINTKDTPWADEPRSYSDLVHRACAIYRILDPKVNIPVTSAMESLHPGSKAEGLKRGCNVLMHSFTPASVRKHYRIYDGKNTVGDEAENRIQAVKDMVSGIGLYINKGEPGRSKKEICNGKYAKIS
ncbi:MAG: radical SAM protein [Lactobacillaceae bacterium]|jgi:biotin synthase|nr:radical SAM protein [Lactobacillaceae bacterium]